MKITLDSNSVKRTSDLIALSFLKQGLLIGIAEYGFDKALRAMWIELIDRIRSEAVTANYQNRLMKLEFDYSFDDNYQKFAKDANLTRPNLRKGTLIP